MDSRARRVLGPVSGPGQAHRGARRGCIGTAAGGGARPRKVQVDIEEELGDMVFTLAAFANVMGLSLERGTERAIAKYDGRDSTAWKVGN